MYMYWEGILVTVACGSGSGISTMEVFNPAQPYVSLVLEVISQCMRNTE